MSDVMKFLDYDGLSTFKSQMDILLADKQDIGDCVLKTGDTMSGALTIGSRAAGTTVGAASLAIGNANEATNYNSMAQGKDCLASGDSSLASGIGAKATGTSSHALGSVSGSNVQFLASGKSSLAVGAVDCNSENTEAYIKTTGIGSVATGADWNDGKISAESLGAVAMGMAKNGTILSKAYGSFAKGNAYGDSTNSANITSQSSGSTAQGRALEGGTIVSGKSDGGGSGAFTNGIAKYGKISATGAGSFASGNVADGSSSTISTREISATQGGTVAIGCLYGNGANKAIKASGYGSVAMGCCEGAGDGSITASSSGAICGGIANGGTNVTSVAGGIAWGLGVHCVNQQAAAVFGKYNKENASGDIFIIGKGNAEATGNRANAFRVTTGGVVYSTGAYNTSGADYAEITEWVDGNPRAEDRAGKFVCMQGNKMRFATSQDVRSRIGVVSPNPAINGDAFSEEWQGKYKTDIFGRIESRIVHHDDEYDENGDLIQSAYDDIVYTISENYDPTQEYIPREKRREYDNFGMLGKLIVIDDGTCQVDGYCYPNDNAIATPEQDANKGFYVMERLDATHIKILLK